MLATILGWVISILQASSGWRIERYPSGEIYKNSHYHNGLLDGDSYEYAVGHQLRAHWHFKHGRKHGAQEGWYIEGPKRFEAFFRDGILEGLQTEWHQNGTIFRSQYFVRGVETDRKVLFFDGEIFSNYARRENRKYGIDGGSLCMETKREGEK